MNIKRDPLETQTHLALQCPGLHEPGQYHACMIQIIDEPRPNPRRHEWFYWKQRGFPSQSGRIFPDQLTVENCLEPFDKMLS